MSDVRRPHGRVTTRALMRRINEKLAKHAQRLDQCAKWRERAPLPMLGEFYIIDLNLNMLVQGHVNVEALGRELGVLAVGEVLADDEAPADFDAFAIGDAVDDDDAIDEDLP